MRKKRFLLIIILVLCSVFTANVFAYEPYTNYTYTSEENTEPEPQAYIPSKLISGKTLGISQMSQPEDICVSEDGLVYVADTGNNRILILDNSMKLTKIISSFNNNGHQDAFKKPNGLFVVSGKLYVADTDNKRVVILKENGDLESIISSPSSALMEEHPFTPTKVAVDFTGRIFVVSSNENRGVLEFSQKGEFNGFFGAVETTSPFNIFKILATKTQRNTMEQVVPVVYSNVNVDKSGFVYSTVSMIDVSGDINNNIFVRKMNPGGTDILKRYGTVPVIGDADWLDAKDDPQMSKLCDVAVNKTGIYSVLGQRYGRVFTYDDNGNLLYIFGAIGTSFGQFENPVALDIINENEYLVLDRNHGQIVLFTPTEYGKLIAEASAEYFKRNYDIAEKKYDEMLNYTSKFKLAYIGKAKCLYKKKDFTQAMKYFELGQDREGYSEAFRYYRIQKMNENFGLIMTIVIIIIVLFPVIFIIRKRWWGKK